MMTLSYRNPARDLISISDEMNRLVSNVFGEGGRETSLFKGTWSPAVDISEDADNFYLHIELPGMKKEDVKVQYAEGMLSITGEKKAQKEAKNLNLHRVERTYGRFERSFRVASNIVSDKIAAEFSDGVLSVILPKADEVKPKEIEVSIK